MFNNIYQITFTFSLLLLGISVKILGKIFIRKFGKNKNIKRSRQLLLEKFLSYFTLTFVIICLIFIWNVKLSKIWLVLTSILGVGGIAFFASWSILSNIFSAFLLFFTVPFKIEDMITIKEGDNIITGTIVDMTLFYVYLEDNAGNRINIPNNIILQKIVLKHTENRRSS
jgi:small-conductance mechanosensitive channel